MELPQVVWFEQKLSRVLYNLRTTILWNDMTEIADITVLGKNPYEVIDLMNH
jgi:hypothetical protein